MPASWSAKDERQYQAIRKSCVLRRGETGQTVADCERMAAATVNKQRRKEGRTLRGATVQEVPTGSKRSFELEYVEEDGSVLGRLQAAKVKRAGRTVWDIKGVFVQAAHRRKGIATKLYEAAAREACARRAPLASTDVRAGTTEAFWKKQLAKGRASILGKGRERPWYILDCPPPASLAALGREDGDLPRRFNRLVNMSPAEIRRWSKDPRNKLASYDETRARLPQLAKLKAKDPAKWTEADRRLAGRVVSFNSRMLGMKREHGCTTKIAVSLKNWGHDAGCRLPPQGGRRGA